MDPSDARVIITTQDVMESLAVERLRAMVDDLAADVSDTYPAALGINDDALRLMARKALVVAVLTVYNGGK